MSQVHDVAMLGLAAALVAPVAPLAAQKDTVHRALTSRSDSAPAAPRPESPRGGQPPAPPPIAIQLKVLLNVDYVQGAPLSAPPNQGFGLRRARLFAQGSIPAGLGFRIQLDPSVLANGPQGAAPFRGSPLVEGYLSYQRGEPFLIQAGQQRIPFGLASTTGAPSLATPEFAQFARYLEQRVSAFRDIGVTVQGRTSIIEYAAGLFNGAGINTLTDNDSSRDAVGRLTISVIPGLQLSADAWSGHSGSLYSRAPGAAPLKTFYDNTGFHRYSTDVRFARGPALVTGEYGIDRTSYTATAVNPVPGKRRLDRIGYNAMGALRLSWVAPELAPVEVVARYDQWDGDQNVTGNRITEYVAGVNYYLLELNAPDDRQLGRPLNYALRESRVMVYFEHDTPNGIGAAALLGSPALTSTTRFHMRWDLFF